MQIGGGEEPREPGSGEPGQGTAQEEDAAWGGCCVTPAMAGLQWLADAVSWQRPVYSLATFLCANLIYWFLALSSMRVYYLLSVIVIGSLLVQLIVDVVLSRVRGAQVWRSLSGSWEVIGSKTDCRPWLSHCIAESWTSYSVFLQEMSHFKQQNPGKFCLLVCSLCTFLTILGSCIPGAVLCYFMLLCAFFCPLLKFHEFGQKIYNKVNPVLQKLDFGVWSYISQWRKERAEKRNTRTCEDDSEVDLSTLYPQVSSSTLIKELSVTDTEASEISLTDNGTFNLSEGYTPQTDTSEDFDRPSDQEDAFVRDLAEFPALETASGSGTDDSSFDLPAQQKRKKERAPVGRERHLAAGLTLPLTNDQAFKIVSGMAEDVIVAAVSAAITDQLQATQQASGQPAASPSDYSDTDEADDFELLDQSELEEIEEEQELAQRQEPEGHGKKTKLGFLANLLGGH